MKWEGTVLMFCLFRVSRVKPMLLASNVHCALAVPDFSLTLCSAPRCTVGDVPAGGMSRAAEDFGQGRPVLSGEGGRILPAALGG